MLPSDHLGRRVGLLISKTPILCRKKCVDVPLFATNKKRTEHVLFGCRAPSLDRHKTLNSHVEMDARAGWGGLGGGGWGEHASHTI